MTNSKWDRQSGWLNEVNGSRVEETREDCTRDPDLTLDQKTGYAPGTPVQVGLRM